MEDYLFQMDEERKPEDEEPFDFEVKSNSGEIFIDEEDMFFGANKNRHDGHDMHDVDRMSEPKV